MTLNDLRGYLKEGASVRIFRDEEEVFTGFYTFISGRYPGADLSTIGLTGEEEIKTYTVVPEIRHKDWKKLGLMEPIRPEETPQYRFSDLIMWIYHVITI